MFPAEVIIVPIFLLSVFGILAIYFVLRNRERLAMIERGADPSLFQTKSQNTYSLGLRTALFLIGIGLGIFAGSIIDAYTILEDETAYFGTIFLFGGLSLAAGHYLAKKEKMD
ncbi:MAG TPA: hypothetical protein DCQ31_08290 [Bacteroidales bacterium]|nr:hypothetical protein [Bacteroidales bacterium]